MNEILKMMDSQVESYAETLWRIYSKAMSKPYNQQTPAEQEASKAFSGITKEIHVNDDRTITYIVIGGVFTTAATD